MSDARVERAIQASIDSYKDQIGKQLSLQHVAYEMMRQSGNTDHALYSLTSRYKECDRVIGNLRTTIRNLQAKM